MWHKCFKKYMLLTFKDECKNIILYIFKVLNSKAKELFFIIAERQSTVSDEWIANRQFWISDTCMASDFYPLTPLHEGAKSKSRQPEWNTNLQNRCEFMDLCCIWQASQLCFSLMKWAFTWAGGRGERVKKCQA